MKSRNMRLLVYAVVAILLTIIDIVFLNFISIGGITPDLLLILVVWISIYEGQFIGIFSGFAIGLLFDIASMDVLGTNALTKTVAALVAGFFYREGKEARIIGSISFLAIVLLCSVIHNLIYFFFYIKLSEISFLSFFLKYGIALSVYTTVFAVFGMLMKSQRGIR